MNEILNTQGNVVLEENVGKAVVLHQNIMGNFELAAMHLYEVCRLLKEMKDTKLYTYLGYETFDAYVEEKVGIKKRQAYTYISAYEKLGKDFLQSNAQIGITKLELLTKALPSERADLVENNDLQEMTVEELKARIEELESHAKQLSLFEDELEETKKELEEEKEKSAESEALTEKINKLEEEILRLTEENKELSKQPVDVAVQEMSKEEKEKIRNEIKAELEKSNKDTVDSEIKKAVEKAEADATAKFEKEKKKIEKEAVKNLKASLDEVEKEKAAAIDRARELEKKLEISNNSHMVKFQYLFDECQNNINSLIRLLREIAENDKDASLKLSNAVTAFIDAIKDSIGAEE